SYWCELKAKEVDYQSRIDSTSAPLCSLWAVKTGFMEVTGEILRVGVWVQQLKHNFRSKTESIREEVALKKSEALIVLNERGRAACKGKGLPHSEEFGVRVRK